MALPCIIINTEKNTLLFIKHHDAKSPMQG